MPEWPRAASPPAFPQGAGSLHSVASGAQPCSRFALPSGRSASRTSAARSLAGNTFPPGSTLSARPRPRTDRRPACGPSAARAECRNRPLGPKASTMPRASVAWVRLQRVPPERRILTPGSRFLSSRMVLRPRWAARAAAISPAGPPPIIATSHFVMEISYMARATNGRILHH